MHYAQLEALAFNEEFDPDNVEDFTLPPTEIMKKVCIASLYASLYLPILLSRSVTQSILSAIQYT